MRPTARVRDRRCEDPTVRTQAYTVHVGCSGWNYRSWRGELYPPGVPASRWLERYAECFDTVEVNSTFYRLASRDAVAHWVQQTPREFVFAVKASRYLTHIRRLADVGEGIARFYERIQPLVDAARLGPVLWQLPETFRRDDDRLRSTLRALPRGRHAFEFRHSSWFVPEVYSLLSKHNAALVVGDHPERRFQTLNPTADWSYVRFHHGSRGRRGNYSRTEIATWARRLHDWRTEREVYAYFNNDWEAFAVRNAQALRMQLHELEHAPRARPRLEAGEGAAAAS
jgi:uncharacterized protein YecE (DUF72 family)